MERRYLTDMSLYSNSICTYNNIYSQDLNGHADSSVNEGEEIFSFFVCGKFFWSPVNFTPFLGEYRSSSDVQYFYNSYAY